MMSELRTIRYRSIHGEVRTAGPLEDRDGPWFSATPAVVRFGDPLPRAIKPEQKLTAVACRRGPKFLLPVVVSPEPLLGRTSWPS